MPTPSATYRLQLHAGFDFDAAAAIADYLVELGVSHIYASPYLQAAAGSMHGYDVISHDRPNGELGGTEGHSRFCSRLGECGLGQILDIVPNHMSIASRENVWWWDVLENGQSSRYASYFDVDWRPPEERLHDTVMLPILGDHYGRVIEAGEIKIVRNGGAFRVEYGNHVGPVAPRSLNDLLKRAAVRCGSDTLAFIADALAFLPLSTATDSASVLRRHRDKEALRELIGRLCNENSAIAGAIDETLAEINASADDLDALLSRQNYRLTYWRSAQQDLDYRRFFDINTLVSLRMEDEQVFEDTHRLVLKWVAQGVIDGVRIDHPDGLLDPKQYLERIRKGAPGAWVVVEKILEPFERLPDDWPTAGTTGYDFLNRLGGLFVDPKGEEPITRFYQEFTDQKSEYADLIRAGKLQAVHELFGSDVNRLASQLLNVCERQRRYRDYTRGELIAMIREVIACFPVYRTYVQAGQQHVSADDVRYVNEAIDAAKVHRSDVDQDLFEFMRDLLLLKMQGPVEFKFVMRFQQSTGAVMAKGVEDTTFYNYNRLMALNEVGGDPSKFGHSIDEFHESCRQVQQRWPQTMLTTTTHDTKRSEDTRARISVLSEMPSAWAKAVKSWSTMNKQHRQSDFPDRNMEYLLYQNMLGAWPIDADRAVAYAQKAARESKAHTSWTQPQPVYEQAIESFVRGILADGAFVASFAKFVEPLIPLGRVNSLAQTLIKLTAPGIPDIYQGNELWDPSLVDPDNRRPVDFTVRRKLLAELPSLSLEQVMARSDEGFPKLLVTTRALHARQAFPAAFGVEGAYVALETAGRFADRVIGFTRGGAVATIVPRVAADLKGSWKNTTIELPEGSWKNEFTGEQLAGGKISVGDLFDKFPVALLTQSEKQNP